MLSGVVAIGVLLAGCTAGDVSQSSSTTSGPAGNTSGSEFTGPAPGVTDDTIKIGVTYVDLDAISDVVTIDHGDYELAYQALFDDINAAGGIHGRSVEPIYAPVNPVGSQAADATCLQLTEDEDVFAVIGFFLEDEVLCPLELNETAVIGGAMTPERLQWARAPWYTTEGGTDLQNDIVRAMAGDDIFDGTLGVFARPDDEDQMNDIVLPLLEDLGVDVADSAVTDAPDGDSAATNAATAIVAERFEAEGIDQVLLIGNSGLVWANGVENLDYRPQLLITDLSSVLAFTLDRAARDTSLLEGAVGGGLYGGTQNIYELDSMQECLDILADEGVDVPEPDSLSPDDQPVFTAAFTACKNIALLRALLDAAGPDLDYGSLAASSDGLEVDVPIQSEPMTYGPPPAADGNPVAHLFDWDEEANTFVPQDG